MHIGFDISQTGSGKAGCGYFAHAMIRQMLRIYPDHRYSLFPSFGDFYFDPQMPRRNPYPGRNVTYGPLHNSRDTAAIFWSRRDLETTIEKPDVLHSNNFWCPIQALSAKLIYTLYDMSFLVEPSWTTETNRIGCFEGVFRSSIMADWIIAISNATREHYLKMFPYFPTEHIRVIYPCSRFNDSASQGERPKMLQNVTPGAYWLSVGTIEPRKNQRMLVAAYARYLTSGGCKMPLVLAGGRGWLMEDLADYLNNLGITSDVIVTGRVSDDELVWLYRNCYANLYPSLFEGFGLPVLEGIQFGAATLASRTTSIPEITGEAAVLLDPKDTGGWTRAMLKLAIDKSERQRLKTSAFGQAAKFDPKKSAMSLFQLYKEALQTPKKYAMKKG